MDSNLRYFQYYQEVADRYCLNLDELKNIDSMDSLIDGYCVLSNDKEYAYAYKNKSLIVEGELDEVYDFVMLRLFLDKYRTGNFTLPEVERNTYWTTEKMALSMSIMLKPLNSYNDLLSRFDDAENELASVVKDVETFNGYESQDDGGTSINGTIPNIEFDEYRVIKPVTDGVWDIFHIAERSNGRKVLDLRIYGEQYLYEYILNNHIGAVS